MFSLLPPEPFRTPRYHSLRWSVLLTIITGAFGAHPDHDAHLLSTLSAIQILVTHNALDRIDKLENRVVKCDFFIQHSLFSSHLKSNST